MIEFFCMAVVKPYTCSATRHTTDRLFVPSTIGFEAVAVVEIIPENI